MSNALPATTQITTGARGSLTARHNMFHLGVDVPAGSTGEFTYIDDRTACFRLDQHFLGLEEWDNEIVFSAEDADCWTDGASLDPRDAARMRVALI